MLKKSTIITIAVIVLLAVLYFAFDRRSKPELGQTQLPSSTSPAPFQVSLPAGNAGNVLNYPSGLKVEILRQGSGAGAAAGNMVTVNYVGTLANGKKFDSSYDRGQPFRFRLGAGEVIEGWEEGILGMKVGEKRRLTIPADLGYGDRGMGSAIPPDSILIFEVEMLKIE